MPQLTDTFAVLTPDLRLETVPVTPDVYSALDERFPGFRGHTLISTHEFESDWGTWEMHPAGDELVILLSGRAQLILRRSDGDEMIDLAAAGDFAIVPQGTWHTAHIQAHCRLLFITPGEGTDNAPEPRVTP